MIVLIVGDYGVGKDTFADMLVEHLGEDANKIKSVTTRKPRYPDEDTHVFVNEQRWLLLSQNYEIIAYTEIGGEHYGTFFNQFGYYDYDVYVVDDVGVRDVLRSCIDATYIVEIKRPKWLIDLPEERLTRERTDSYDYKPDYVVINDTTLEKLDASAREVSYILKDVNK